MVIYTPTKNSSITNKHKEKERRKKREKRKNGKYRKKSA